MPAVEIGQKSAVETGEMPAVKAAQMSSGMLGWMDLLLLCRNQLKNEVRKKFNLKGRATQTSL